MSAWKQACGTPKSVLLVPQGRTYLVNATKFNGPCERKLIIQVSFSGWRPLLYIPNDHNSESFLID